MSAMPSASGRASSEQLDGARDGSGVVDAGHPGVAQVHDGGDHPEEHARLREDDLPARR